MRHRCRLRDACWRCGAPVVPLAQTISSRQPVCAACGAVLAESAAKPAPDAARPQRGLMCVLYYAAACLDPAALRDHLAVLSEHFPPGSRVTTRERSLTGLLPGKFERWFGPVADPRQRDLLRRHAHGGAYGAWFGSAATHRSCHAAELPRLSRIWPLSRGKIARSPWFAARPLRRAAREDESGRCWPSA